MMWEVVTTILGIITPICVGVSGYLFKKNRDLDKRLVNTYSKKETNEVIDMKLEPVRQTQERTAECISELDKTMKELTQLLHDIQLQQAKQRGREEERQGKIKGD